jgi:hypothetical protein
MNLLLVVPSWPVAAKTLSNAWAQQASSCVWACWDVCIMLALTATLVRVHVALRTRVLLGSAACSAHGFGEWPIIAERLGKAALKYVST